MSINTFEDVHSGYIVGQRDVLHWLKGRPVDDDDDPMAPIDRTVEAHFALWCLFHNIAQAAMLARCENAWNAYADLLKLDAKSERDRAGWDTDTW